jgi:spore coat polysaccharide biosynthesis predicted glycosyltransferase SpsG
MRAVAVAQAARHSAVPVTFASSSTGELAGLPARFGFDVYQDGRPRPGWLSDVAPGDAVLFDGYGFAAHDYAAASGAGAKVGVIDDFGTGEFDVDVLVNPNPVSAPAYRLPREATLLVGPRFAPVRSEFLARRRLRNGGTARLLITAGGSDSGGITGRILELLERNRPFERVLVVRGPASTDTVTRQPDWLETATDPADVAAVFDRADAAVAAAGSTTWELLTMGIPTALVKVADNQRHVVDIAAQGGALFLGESDDLERGLGPTLVRLADPGEQRALSRAGTELVDGLGARRVLDALLGKTPRLS